MASRQSQDLYAVEISGLDPVTLARFVNKGLPGTTMPSFAKTLSEEQMTDLLTFIRSW